MRMAARIIARGEWHWQDKRVKRSSAADERAGIDAPPDAARRAAMPTRFPSGQKLSK
jgi:hypothetical protein